MIMSEHLRLCNEQTRQLANVHRGLKQEALLDLAAQEQGFEGYASLHNLLKLLGPEGVPNASEIAKAGGDPRQSPYLSVSTTLRSGWSEADPVNS